MNPSLSAFLSSRFVDRGGGHRARVLDALAEKTLLNDASAREVEAYQRGKLVTLLRHAKQSVPFYKERVPAAERITKESVFDVLRALPVMDRAVVQTEGRNLYGETPAWFAPDATGGSTGTPMNFRVDRATQVARESSLMWADGLAGWRYGERIAMLWGSDRDVRGAVAQWKSGLRWVIENRRWFNAFDMGPDKMAEFHAAMESFGPHIIVAYSGSAFVFARYLRERGIKPSYPLRGLICSAEMLAPEMRREIEDVFGKPCFDRYGNREFGAIAAEGETHDGLRVNHADVILETGSDGQLIVTHLHNRAMPFLRYDTGDLTTIRPDGRLQPVTGRRSDTIRTAGGNLIHGEYFTHLLYGCPTVARFQFVQETLKRYRLLVVAPAETVEQMRAKWTRDILEKVGTDSTVEVEAVAEIPPLPSGKHKFTVSKVSP